MKVYIVTKCVVADWVADKHMQVLGAFAKKEDAVSYMGGYVEEYRIDADEDGGQTTIDTDTEEKFEASVYYGYDLEKVEFTIFEEEVEE